MGSPPFVEMVENERGWGPLLVDKASNKIRRDLFRGQTVFDGEKYGASRSLVNQVAAVMEDWGFNFERPWDETHQHKGFKLINRLHVPESKGHKIRKRAAPKAWQPKLTTEPDAAAEANGESANGRGHHGELRLKLREALLNGEALSDKDAQSKYGGSGGNLRRVIYALEDEGCTFDEYKGPTGKTFALRKAGKGIRKANGHEQNNLLPVPMFGDAADSHEVSFPPLPAFLGHIQVVGQHLERDGTTVSILLRNQDNEEWLVTVDDHKGVTD